MSSRSSTPLLYTFRRCPYAIRARLALAYCGVSYIHREVSLKNKPDEMLLLSEKGTVPVLHVDGEVIDESLDIMRWAVRQMHDGERLAQRFSNPLLTVNDKDFKYWLDRYKYFDRFPEQSQQAYLERALGFLRTLEASFDFSAQHSTARHSCGQGSRGLNKAGEFDFLDAAIFPFIRQFAFVDKSAFDQLDLPLLQEWLDGWLGSKLFSRVMVKLPIWEPTQQACLIDNAHGEINIESNLSASIMTNKKEQPATETPIVEHEPEQHMFYIAMPDGDNATLKYRFQGENQVDFYSTFVPKQHRAKGLAEALVETGLAWANTAELNVLASCWYVDKFIKAA